MSNVKVLKNNADAIKAAMAGVRLGRAVMAGGQIVEGAAKLLMRGPKSGRIYPPKGHQASAGGEAPAIDTGNLANSISTELLSSDSNSAWAQVGTGVEYAEPLEFGTSTMEARPFMRPAFDNNEAKIEEIIRKIAKQNIEGAAQ